MKFLKLVFFLPFFGNITAQSVDKSECKANFYKGNVVATYGVYQVDSTVSFDSLAIKKAEAKSILEAFSQDKIVLAIQKIKANPIFMELVGKYSGTAEQESQNLYDYAQNYKGRKDYEEFTRSVEMLNGLAGGLVNGNNGILHLSLYTNLDEYGDCYFYQIGYDGFEYKILTASVVEAVLYGKDKKELAGFKNDAIGVVIRENGQIITLPLVVKGKYLCDIRLMLCSK